jgi:hypothetical protein
MDTADTATFLQALFGAKPPEAGVQLWHKDTKKAHTYVNLGAAATHATAHGGDTDMYVSAGLARAAAKPSLKRLTVQTCAAIPGVWADIDVNGGPEGKANAAPDLAHAQALAVSVLNPTLIVNSGYGLQAWWLFEGGPWIFATVAERDNAQRLVMAFQAALKAKARELSPSWNMDSTHDLARLMRLPGTFNHKGAPAVKPAPVTLLEHEGGLYTIDAISSVGHEYMTAAAQAATQAATGEGIDVELKGRQAEPSWRVGQLIGVDPDFRVVWERRQVGKMRDWSQSEWDLSIATRLADVGCSDQDIADAITHSRMNFGSDPQGKLGRPDYFRKTIAKARQRADLANVTRERESVRNEASDQLEAIAATGEKAHDSTRTVSLFTELLGGPEIKELVQDSRDPDQARFRLVLADGREVPIGTGADLLSPDRFRSAFAIVTGHVVPGIKREKWHNIVQALLHAATVNEESDETRSARGAGMVAEFVDRGMSTDRNAAMQAHDPFVQDGDVYVPLGPLTQWLRRIKGERTVEADVKQLLIAAGFERKTLNFQRDDGKKSSRSYWVGDADAVA